VPDFMAVTGIEHPDVVWRGDIQFVVHFKDRTFDVHTSAGAELPAPVTRPMREPAGV